MISRQIKQGTDRNSILFLGEPGTGKTHGVAAETEYLLANGYHLPILIQARDIPERERERKHPLGPLLLNDHLLSFKAPALRDVFWSVPSYLQESESKKWYAWTELSICQGAYYLTDSDTAEGLPLVYAWSLSTVNNMKRLTYRAELMKWARQVPEEFYNLFLMFSSVNDPQVRSDMFAILMSLLLESENTKLISTAANWLIQNVLALDKIEENRDLAIRYYSTSIVRKAESMGLLSSESVSNYLPPFYVSTNNIALNKDALAGTYMGGYGEITYDLGRYVLVDRITNVFRDYGKQTDNQYEMLIKKISESQPEFANITPVQLILSAAYEYILLCGWNEEYRYIESDGNKVLGIDWAIRRSHRPQTHGSQSPVMTICEKYVWQARKYILGFLADRMKYFNDGQACYVDDYALLDEFIIPSMETEKLNPDNPSDQNPWHVPEMDSVVISGNPCSKDDVIKSIQSSPNITWERWIQINNSKRQYPINGDTLIALCGYSCFEGSSGVETNIYMSTIQLPICKIDSFIEDLKASPHLTHSLTNPSDWKGGCSSYCYISPKEVCWMPWKERYDSSNTSEFPDYEIYSTVDKCTYNSTEFGDVNYELPSAPIRDVLKVVNTNGSLFYDCNNQIKAASIWVGEPWRTQQSYLLVDKTLLQLMEQNGNTLLWFMREDRRESGKIKERFGDFYSDKDCSYVGFFRNDKFHVVCISPREHSETHPECNDEVLFDLLQHYGGIEISNEETEKPTSA